MEGGVAKGEAAGRTIVAPRAVIMRKKAGDEERRLKQTERVVMRMTMIWNGLKLNLRVHAMRETKDLHLLTVATCKCT